MGFSASGRRRRRPRLTVLCAALLICVSLAPTRDLAARHPALVRRAEEVMRREHVESEDWPLSAPPESK